MMTASAITCVNSAGRRLGTGRGPIVASGSPSYDGVRRFVSSCPSGYIWKNALSVSVELSARLSFKLVSYDVEDATSGSGSFDEGALLPTSLKPLKETSDRVSRAA